MAKCKSQLGHLLERGFLERLLYASILPVTKWRGSSRVMAKKNLIKSGGIPCSTEILYKNLVHTSVNSIILVKDEDTWICPPPPACLPLTPDLSLASSDAGVTSLDGEMVRLRGWTSVVLPTVSDNGTFTGAWPWLWRRKGSKSFRITGPVWVVTGSLWGESWMERGEVTFSPSLCGAVRFIL